MAIALMVVLAIMPARPAGATGPGGGLFGLTPAPGLDGASAPYFSMSIAAGGSAVGLAIITNESRATERLKISRSTGITAANGGSAFSRAFQHCEGPGCWVTISPTLVTLPPGIGEALRLVVHVPRGTRPGQYLAGLTAESAGRPRTVVVGSAGHAQARAIIIVQVSIGVAITVGPLSRLTRRLRITGASGTAIGRTARLDIQVANTGQRFAGGRGTASCEAPGGRVTAQAITGTILPHDEAVIPVNLPGIPEGVRVSCRIWLRYAAHRTTRWNGVITIPDPPSVRMIHTGRGAYSALPAEGQRPWLMALLAVGVLILLAVTGLTILLWRRRRHPLAG